MKIISFLSFIGVFVFFFLLSANKSYAAQCTCDPGGFCGSYTTYSASWDYFGKTTSVTYSQCGSDCRTCYTNGGGTYTRGGVGFGACVDNVVGSPHYGEGGIHSFNPYCAGGYSCRFGGPSCGSWGAGYSVSGSGINITGRYGENYFDPCCVYTGGGGGGGGGGSCSIVNQYPQCQSSTAGACGYLYTQHGGNTLVYVRQYNLSSCGNQGVWDCQDLQRPCNDFVSGHVYVDYNDNDQQDSGEPNVDSTLTTAVSLWGTHNTDASGNWSDGPHDGGTYQAYVSSTPAGYITTSDAKTVSVDYGNRNPTNVNFGIEKDPTQNGFISGEVFVDYDGDNNLEAEDNQYAPGPATNVVVKNSGGTTVATIPVTAPTNTVQNPSFESGTGSWYIQNGTVTQVSGGTSGSYAADANVTAAGNYWDAQLQQTGIPITYGSAYKVSFDAKADVNGKPISVMLQQFGSPYMIYGISQQWNLTTSWQTYYFTFVSNSTDASMNLRFNMGLQTGHYYIDNVSVAKENYVTPLLPNGTYTLSLSSIPAGYAKSPPANLSVTVNGGDQTEKNLGITPLYSASGKVYIDLNRTACWEPAYDALYAPAGTTVTFQGPTNQTFPVVNGSYSTGNVLKAGNYSVTYTVPSGYQTVYPPVGYSVTLGTPGKSIQCDVTLAQNISCW